MIISLLMAMALIRVTLLLPLMLPLRFLRCFHFMPMLIISLMHCRWLIMMLMRADADYLRCTAAADY